MLGAIPQILAMWRAPPWSQRLLTEVGMETFRFVFAVGSLDFWPPTCCFRADKERWDSLTIDSVICAQAQPDGIHHLAWLWCQSLILPHVMNLFWGAAWSTSSC